MPLKNKFIVRLSAMLILYLIMGLKSYANTGQHYIEKIVSSSRNNVFNTIYAIETDSNGYVYLATDRGMYYYNGTDIIPLNNNESNQEIINLYKQKNGTIWALPYFGKIQRIDLRSKKLTSPLRIFNQNNYTAHNAFEDEDGRVYFHAHAKSISRIGIVHHNQLIVDSSFGQGNYFIVHYLNSTRRKSELQERIAMETKTTPLNRMRIVDDQYFTYEAKLFQINRKETKLLFNGLNFGWKNSIIVDILVDHSTLYLAVMGESKGLYTFANNKLTPIVTNKEINGITNDNYGNLYFIDYSNALYKINTLGVSKKSMLLGPSAEIKTVLPRGADSLLINDVHGNLHLFFRNNNKLTTLCRNDTPAEPNSYLNKEGHTVFFLNRNHAFILNPQEQLQVPREITFRNSEFSLLQNAFLLKNNYLLNVKRRLLAYNPARKEQKTFESPYDIKSLIRVSQTHQFEIGTTCGLYHLDYDTSQFFTSIKTGTAIDSNPVVHIIPTQNAVYYYTPQGLYKRNINSKEIQLDFTINQASGFNDALQIIPITNYLISLKPKSIELYQIDQRRVHECEFNSLEGEEVFKGMHANQNEIILWTEHSVYQLPFTSLPKLTTLPSIKFSHLVVNDKHLHYEPKNLNLHYTKKNKLLFHFDIINAFSSFTNKISYELFHQGGLYWKETESEKSITISNLPYGAYQLKIYYSQRLALEIPFELKAQWYQTMLFFFCLAALTALLLIAITAKIIKRKYDKQRMHIQTKNYMLQLEGSSKINQLKPHFVFNALTPIQNYILKFENQKALDYLSNFSVLLRQMLNMSRRIETSLYIEIDFLKNYLELRQQELSNSFDYRLTSAYSESEAHELYIPTLLLQPLIENAITYGLRNNEKQNLIELTFTKEKEKRITVRIKDSGIGFNLSETLRLPHQEHALHIIHERLLLLQHEFKCPLSLHGEIQKDGFEIMIDIPIVSKSR